MLRLFSSRAYWSIGVAFSVGISAYHMPDVRAQDAGTPSVAELQQRLQDLEAVVKQIKDREPASPADTTASAAAARRFAGVLI